MGTTAEKLYKIIESKEAIRQALETKGVVITDETTFAEYAEKINEITNGGAITDEEALLFIGECADGKRKIAKALTQKYEPTNAYETFDEMADKIKTLPLRVEGENNALPQNGGVLQFYDVYNEMVKAYRQFGGEGIYCCAVEMARCLETFSLSNAYAYYTSDGEYITNGQEYKFENYSFGNCFVIYFYSSKTYQVPLNLPNNHVLNIYCLNGIPQIVLSGVSTYPKLSGIFVYTNERITATNENFILRNSSIKEGYFPHLIESKVDLFGTACPNLISVNLPNLEVSTSAVASNGAPSMIFPKLKKINIIGSSQTFQDAIWIFPELIEATNQSISSYGTKIKILYMPKLIKTNIHGILVGNYSTPVGTLKLGRQQGGSIKIGTYSKIDSIIVENGFKCTLDLGYQNSLTEDCIYDLINNLAICEGEDKDKYTITLSKSVATTEMESAIVAKGYLFATLG